ncbi:MAG: lytic transglycosylase F, partial [Burkholderiales bacterium]|nr:lytic transglycosylase F [Burkholderiales bacterium]
MAWLRERFQGKIKTAERTWFSLAAYNAGYGHVQDAQRLAEKLELDPNRWFGH